MSDDEYPTPSYTENPEKREPDGYEFLPQLPDERFESILSAFQQASEGDVVSFQSGIDSRTISSLDEDNIGLQISFEKHDGDSFSTNLERPSHPVSYIYLSKTDNEASLSHDNYHGVHHFTAGYISDVEVRESDESDSAGESEIVLDWSFLPEAVHPAFRHPDLLAPRFYSVPNELHERRDKMGVDTDGSVVMTQSVVSAWNEDTIEVPMKLVPKVCSDGIINLYNDETGEMEGYVDLSNTKGVLNSTAIDHVDWGVREELLNDSEFLVDSNKIDGR